MRIICLLGINAVAEMITFQKISQRWYLKARPPLRAYPTGTVSATYLTRVNVNH